MSYMIKIALFLLACTAAVLFAGYKSFAVSYFDHSPNWGTVVRVQQEADRSAVVVSVKKTAEKQIEVLTDEVNGLLKKSAMYVAHEKSLYLLLFTAVITLEEQSALSTAALAKFGPLTTLYLKDFTGTDVASNAVSQFESTIVGEALSERSQASELRMNFRAVVDFRTEFLEKINAKHAQDFAGEVELFTAAQPPVSDQYNQYDPSTMTFAPFEQMRHRGWDVSDEDAHLLYNAHKLISDIDTVQTRLATATASAAQKLILISEYRAQLADSTESGGVKALLFMQNKSRGVVKEGDKLYRCTLGVFRCTPVAEVKVLFDDVFSTPHPTSGKVVPGFLIKIEFFNRANSGPGQLYLLPPTLKR